MNIYELNAVSLSVYDALKCYYFWLCCDRHSQDPLAFLTLFNHFFVAFSSKMRKPWI